MPNIKQSYQTTNISIDNLYQESLCILKELGASEIKENSANPNLKEITAVIPSIWGWGGMTISVQLEQTTNNVLLSLDGYIAQLATGSLTKKMDEFLQKMQTVLKTTYNSSFEYEKLTRFLPNYKLLITEKDKKVFVAIIIGTFVTTILGELSGFGVEVFITGAVVLLGYFLGKKYLNK